MNLSTSARGRRVATQHSPPLRQRFDTRYHCLTIQNPGDVMRRERCGFAPAASRQVGEQNINQAAANFGKGVPVEEQERRGAMAAEKKIERFEERQRLATALFPLDPDFLVSFRIMAVLSFSSFARSFVEADDRLPTPVLDKRGSGL